MPVKTINSQKVVLCSLFLVFCCLTTGCAPVSKVVPPDYVDPITLMEFISIEGGTYQMGDHTQKQESALPVHQVTLAPFAVGMYEVSFNQYDSFCEATGREKPSDEEWGRGNRPAINVSWQDAMDFAQWLSNELGLSFSLPTEAQWEYFARAGTKGNYWTGKKLPPDAANCRDCGSRWDGKMTAPVGSFQPNPWGIYDTAGNVAEWTLDDWQPGYEGVPSDGSAWLNGSTGEKIYRGGAWEYPLEGLASATRDWAKKSDAFNTIGFRLVINNFAAQPKK
jgi:formylglycine-generating enzyme required for sulfatase activity